MMMHTAFEQKNRGRPPTGENPSVLQNDIFIAQISPTPATMILATRSSTSLQSYHTLKIPCAPRRKKSRGRWSSERRRQATGGLRPVHLSGYLTFNICQNEPERDTCSDSPENSLLVLQGIVKCGLLSELPSVLT
ncbi:hypothetical protein TNCV_2014051 [Trichonephila clavipes]|nr:hypothetical protein TNCV_2014051 [Trichonephila clavipes]